MATKKTTRKPVKKAPAKASPVQRGTATAEAVRVTPEAPKAGSIRFLKQIIGSYGCYVPGEVATLQPEVMTMFVKAGVAEWH